MRDIREPKSQKLIVYKDTKVYIVAPRAYASGGPEALHQLCSLFIMFGIDAYMFYTGNRIGDPKPSQYSIYMTKTSSSIEYSAHNILLVPEVYVDRFKNVKNIQTAIWWLSVFNFYNEGNHKKYITAYDLNICSTHYVAEHLHSIGITNTVPMRDMLNLKFTRAIVDTSEKEDLVAYNPVKGIDFTREIMNANQDLRFIPIMRMSVNEVVSALAKCKLYIDFGHHPGSDKLPKEAATLMCCVLTGRRGCASDNVDYPLPKGSQINDDYNSIPLISDTMHDMLKNYSVWLPKFKRFRNLARQDEQLMPKQLNDILDRRDKVEYQI